MIYFLGVLTQAGAAASACCKCVPCCTAGSGGLWWLVSGTPCPLHPHCNPAIAGTEQTFISFQLCLVSRRLKELGVISSTRWNRWFRVSDFSESPTQKQMWKYETKNICQRFRKNQWILIKFRKITLYPLMLIVRYYFACYQPPFLQGEISDSCAVLTRLWDSQVSDSTQKSHTLWIKVKFKCFHC